MVYGGRGWCVPVPCSVVWCGFITDTETFKVVKTYPEHAAPLVAVCECWYRGAAGTERFGFNALQCHVGPGVVWLVADISHSGWLGQTRNTQPLCDTDRSM